MAASIATRTGDDGRTRLIYGQRVSKSHPRIEAVGAFDELNVALGVAKANCAVQSRRNNLIALQSDLIALMGEIACDPADAARYASSNFPKVNEGTLARIDADIAAIEARNLRFDGWASPGANPHSAALEMARVTARRAERRLVALVDERGDAVRPLLLQIANRLADLLWLMAREAEADA
ncbi:MAG: cob(I)yrinic acid a,c-diamide adenosyltransferase [Opitutaceae bacterium]|nr:cob(I)yrinic acid a,c-diamide adenosyltransferase [Opitutaceae bacterium]